MLDLRRGHEALHESLTTRSVPLLLRRLAMSRLLHGGILVGFALNTMAFATIPVPSRYDQNASSCFSYLVYASVSLPP
jgi:hypothetical protein